MIYHAKKKYGGKNHYKKKSYLNAYAAILMLMLMLMFIHWGTSL
jgi:hypothetical protein